MNSKPTSIELTKFGLNSYEAKSYLSLLERYSLTATEVSRISKIPRSRVYETLENLMTKGLCNLIPGNVKRYSAVNPVVLKEKFLKTEREKLNVKLEKLRNNMTKIEEELTSLQNVTDGFIEKLIPPYKKSRSLNDPFEYIEIIKDPDLIHRRYIQLIEETKDELLAFVKSPFTGPPEKLAEQVDKMEIGILERGIRVKGIYEIPADEDRKRMMLEMIKHDVKEGKEARVMRELPMKMAIFDSRIVVCFLEDQLFRQISHTAQVVEHHALAKSLKMLFETLWEQAEDYNVFLNSQVQKEADVSKN